MPVLLLAQGDPQAKDLLRKAIHARYGLRPPALDSLHINFKGRLLCAGLITQDPVGVVSVAVQQA